MPPKYKFTREQIVDAALEIVRAEGMAAVTARAVAQKLQSSPKVIFGYFETMELLQEATVQAGIALYMEFLAAEIQRNAYPQYKAMGMAYIRFAKEETQLFKLLFMCDRAGRTQETGEDVEMAVELIMKNNGFSREQAKLLHLEMWICVHGIATMLATAYLDLEWELISRIITDTYQGIRERMLREEK